MGSGCCATAIDIKRSQRVTPKFSTIEDQSNLQNQSHPKVPTRDPRPKQKVSSKSANDAPN